MTIGQSIIFAGKRWEVVHVAEEEKRISLKPAAGGRPPNFVGGGQVIHDIIRQEMYRLYASEETPVFCNKDALRLFEEGRHIFDELRLKSMPMMQLGTTVHILPWLGDKTVNTITMLLRFAGLKADCFSGIIDVRDTDIAACRQAFKNILSAPRPEGWKLASNVPNTFIEKHDAIVPKELRDLNYAARFFDIAGAWRWMSSLPIL